MLAVIAHSVEEQNHKKNVIKRISEATSLVNGQFHFVIQFSPMPSLNFCFMFFSNLVTMINNPGFIR